MNNTHFLKSDGVELKDLFQSQLEVLHTLIDANDKNYNQRFENVIQGTAQALAASDREVNKAEIASEKRFDAVNEFRATLADQQRNLMPRNEVEILIKGLNDKVDALNTSTITKQSLTTGQGIGVQQGWGWAVAAVMFAVAVAGFIINFSK